MKQRKYNRSHSLIWHQNKMAIKGNMQLKTWPLVLEFDLFFTPTLFMLWFYLDFVYTSFVLALWPELPLCSWPQIASLWLQRENKFNWYVNKRTRLSIINSHMKTGEHSVIAVLRREEFPKYLNRKKDKGQFVFLSSHCLDQLNSGYLQIFGRQVRG